MSPGPCYAASPVRRGCQCPAETWAGKRLLATVGLQQHTPQKTDLIFVRAIQKGITVCPPTKSSFCLQPVELDAKTLLAGLASNSEE